MKHILGMSKSHLDLRGAKSAKLELDYLRLVYAVKEIRRGEDNAQGYLVVLAPHIKDRVKQWECKYEAEGYVKVIYESVPTIDKSKLEEEKLDNIVGMVAGTIGSEVGGRSRANFGQKIGEKALRKNIFGAEPNVEEVTDKSKFPFGIQWDFYGVINGSQFFKYGMRPV